MKAEKTEFIGLTLSELKTLVERWGEKSYRAKQIAHWLYHSMETDISLWSNIPGKLRKNIAEMGSLTLPKMFKVLRDDDGTALFTIGMHDNHWVESVLIQDMDRRTLCVSSQVGCPMRCKFCATGKMGYTRNLSAGEIIGQLIVANEFLGPLENITNVVFMGMGEPLLNLDEVARAVEIMTSDWGFGIGVRHITISTAGLVPQIYKLIERGFKVRLAISIGAPDENVRRELMPKAAEYSIDELLDAAEDYYSFSRRWVTIEQIMIAGRTDTSDMARLLADRVHNLNVKVNLIPFNPVDGIPYKSSEENDIIRFRAYLMSRGITVTVRDSRGQSVQAACGQLVETSLLAPASARRRAVGK